MNNNRVYFQAALAFNGGAAILRLNDEGEINGVYSAAARLRDADAEVDRVFRVTPSTVAAGMLTEETIVLSKKEQHGPYMLRLDRADNAKDWEDASEGGSWCAVITAFNPTARMRETQVYALTPEWRADPKMMAAPMGGFRWADGATEYARFMPTAYGLFRVMAELLGSTVEGLPSLTEVGPLIKVGETLINAVQTEQSFRASRMRFAGNRRDQQQRAARLQFANMNDAQRQAFARSMSPQHLTMLGSLLSPEQRSALQEAATEEHEVH